MDVLIAVLIFTGYVGMWLFTTKRLYADHYKKWMDQEIEEARRKARKSGKPFDAEETLYRLKKEWRRESGRYESSTEHEKLIPLVAVLGMLWWIAWPMKWMSNDFGSAMPESYQETLLKNEALEAELDRLRDPGA